MSSLVSQGQPNAQSIVLVDRAARLHSTHARHCSVASGVPHTSVDNVQSMSPASGEGGERRGGGGEEKTSINFVVVLFSSRKRNQNEPNERRERERRRRRKRKRIFSPKLPLSFLAVHSLSLSFCTSFGFRINIHTKKDFFVSNRTPQAVFMTSHTAGHKMAAPMEFLSRLPYVDF